MMPWVWVCLILGMVSLPILIFLGLELLFIPICILMFILMFVWENRQWAKASSQDRRL